MTQGKAEILSHNVRAPSRGRRWIAGLAAIPLFGVVAAFGIAPDTLVERVETTRVTQEIPLSPTLGGSEPLPGFVREERIARGDTVARLLSRLDADDPELLKFLNASKEARAFTTQLRPGRIVRVRASEAGEMQSLDYLTPGGSLFTVEKDPGGYKAGEREVPLESRVLMASGTINSSLFAATDAAGLSDAVAMQLADIFSSDVDFHRDLRRGDRFAVVYEALYHEGEYVKAGRVLAAEFVNQGKSYEAIWFQAPDGSGGYYTPQGKSIRKAFLRSPLEFTRITSGFSMRYHPILKRWRAHRGVDYGAPTGTRVRTTGDGVVDFAGPRGAYGNLVVVRHSGKYSTYYAHLSRFGDGIRRGTRVSQGDIVGYVGSTGLATGPHLHYEFHINGVEHDPLRVVMPEAPPITPALKAAFLQHAEQFAHRIDLMRTLSVARVE